MTRKKKIQKHEVREVNEEASTILHTVLSRPKNQHQLRNVTPINVDEARVSSVNISPFPSHPSNGPPSPHTQEAIADYHKAINFTPIQPMETQMEQLQIPRSLEEVQGRGVLGGAALEKVREMMKTVNVVLGLRNGTETLGEGGVISTQETEHTRNVEQDEGERVQPQQPQAGGNGVPKQPWVSLFKPKPLTAKGVSLSFISPTVCDGSPVAMLEQADLDEMSVIWESAVIMYVVGDRPSIGNLQSLCMW